MIILEIKLVILSHFTKLKAQVKTLLVMIQSQGKGDKLRSNEMYVQVFSKELWTDSITDSSHMRELTDCSISVLVDKWYVHYIFF